MNGTLLDQVLAPGGLAVVFQPVLEYNASGWKLLALEGLVRGPLGTNLHSADVLFAYARRRRAEAELDRTCASTILREAARFGPGLRLNVNVHGLTLERDRGFVGFLADRLAETSFDARRLTLEIVEHSASAGGPGFAAALGSLRELGVKIALDDIGLGQSNYRMLLDVRPDFLKIDRYLVAGCSTDSCRRAIVNSIGHLASSLGARAVAEGVETVADLRTVLDDGIGSFQGFLLACPASAADLGCCDDIKTAVSGLPVRPGSKWAGLTDWLGVVRSNGRPPRGKARAIFAA